MGTPFVSALLEVDNFVYKHCNDTKRGQSHDYNHMKRVSELAIKIYEVEYYIGIQD